jgi:L-fuculose-phosphate aldolase
MEKNDYKGDCPMANFLEICKQVRDTAESMLRFGLTSGTSGNVSMRIQESQQMAITPSAMTYDRINPEDIVGMDFHGNKIWGSRKPSSEWALHSLFYQMREDAGALVHTHSPYATAAAVLGEPIPMILAESVAVIGGEIAVAPYRTFGTNELAEAAVQACGSRNAVLLANHGVVAVGKDLQTALQCAITVEETAKIYLLSKAAGTPKPIPESALPAIFEAFHKYTRQ